jgi:hypothetical protein
MNRFKQLAASKPGKSRTGKNDIIDQPTANTSSNLNMEMWFNITDTDYTDFCGNSDTKARTAIVKASFLQKDKFCSSKAQLLCDLAYQALEYGASSQLSYPSTATLLVLISNELNDLSQPIGKSENLSPVERYKEGVRFRFGLLLLPFLTSLFLYPSAVELEQERPR